MYGSRVSGYARDDSDYDVLLILRDYSKGIKYFYETIDEKLFSVLTVDNNALELDAKKGNFGDFIASRLLSPYSPLSNADYLEKVEFQLKKRFTEEDLEDLVIEYGELSRGLVVEPEYLVLARMKKRSRSYPPVKYSYIKMLRKDLKEKNMGTILKVYRKVLKDLDSSRMINFDGAKITFENEYLDKILSLKILNKVVNIVDFGKRAFSAYLTHGKAGKVNLDVFVDELTSKFRRGLQITLDKQEIEDPKNFLFLKTEEGLTCLNEKNSTVKFIQKLRREKNIEVKHLGGALNEVYLVTVDTTKLVVKTFTNWHNFKWFMINVVSFGTKNFSLLGKTRLANEYEINRFLAKNNILVPKIVSISLKDRIIVEEFIEGTSASALFRKVFAKKELTDKQKQLCFEFGEIISKIHSLNVVIGDCKPENFMIRKDEKICVLDLEQGERNGDKTWDLAEFLYFSGHYGLKFTGAMREFVEQFIQGYQQHGDKAVLKKAADFRYSRIFFGYTFLPIINSIISLLLAL
jgi:tRNA A-37 threonylcarbamoyl transferase component Bud32